MNYSKVIKKLENSNRIIVTGPQRSGTRIIAKCIAEDLDYEYIDELDFNISDKKKFYNMLEKDNIVVQCPALSHICDRVNAVVVFCNRDLSEIKRSQKRIDWDDNKELRKYGLKSGNINEIKYTVWEKWQRRLCKQDTFNIDYKSLKGHKLWRSKDEREKLRNKNKWGTSST